MSELFFKPSEVTHRGRGLTYDDVLIVPNFSQVPSRSAPDLSAPFTQKWSMKIPLVSANMDTVTEWEMALAMARLGGVGILHRFMSAEDQGKQVQKLREAFDQESIVGPIVASIGVKSEALERADYLVAEGVDVITIDIAHGGSMMMIETLEAIKKKFPDTEVVAGNVASVEATRRLIEAGADCIKVGIGPGSMCTTRIITGCGVPQLTAIALCVEEAKKENIPVIADGGIRTSGDVVKALACGASSVMLGGLLAGHLETPGELKGGMKKYRGMASKDAQVSWRGELPEGMAAEGAHSMVPCRGPLKCTVNELTGGIRSGMSYVGAHTLEKLAHMATLIEVSAGGVLESKAHGLS